MRNTLLLSLALLLPLNAAAHSRTIGERAEVQVYDRTAGEFLPLYRHGGRTWVAGEPGHEYEIRVTNRRDERLLAVTSVDGVNVVSGETATPAQSGYVLAPGGDVRIEGWRKSLEQVAAFYFTELADSYAARTGRPDDVGVIGVALFAERRHWSAPRWPYSGDGGHERDRSSAGPPRDESAAQDAGAPQSQSGSHAEAEERLGTGHGRSEWSQAGYTDFERASDAPAEIIAIHYDSYRKLVARGVIPRHHQRGGWRDEPRPFPGRFVPDPR